MKLLLFLLVLLQATAGLTRDFLPESEFERLLYRVPNLESLPSGQLQGLRYLENKYPDHPWHLPNAEVRAIEKLKQDIQITRRNLRPEDANKLIDLAKQNLDDYSFFVTQEYIYGNFDRLYEMGSQNRSELLSKAFSESRLSYQFTHQILNWQTTPLPFFEKKTFQKFFKGRNFTDQVGRLNQQAKQILVSSYKHGGDKTLFTFTLLKSLKLLISSTPIFYQKQIALTNLKTKQKRNVDLFNLLSVLRPVIDNLVHHFNIHYLSLHDHRYRTLHISGIDQQGNHVAYKIDSSVFGVPENEARSMSDQLRLSRFLPEEQKEQLDHFFRALLLHQQIDFNVVHNKLLVIHNSEKALDSLASSAFCLGNTFEKTDPEFILLQLILADISLKRAADFLSDAWFWHEGLK